MKLRKPPLYYVTLADNDRCVRSRVRPGRERRVAIVNPFKAFFVLAGLLHGASPEQAMQWHGPPTSQKIYDADAEDQYSNVSPGSGGVVSR